MCADYPNCISHLSLARNVLKCVDLGAVPITAVSIFAVEQTQAVADFDAMSTEQRPCTVRNLSEWKG